MPRTRVCRKCDTALPDGESECARCGYIDSPYYEELAPLLDSETRSRPTVWQALPQPPWVRLLVTRVLRGVQRRSSEKRDAEVAELLERSYGEKVDAFIASPEWDEAGKKVEELLARGGDTERLEQWRRMQEILDEPREEPRGAP